jgi:hypothetical protein
LADDLRVQPFRDSVERGRNSMRIAARFLDRSCSRICLETRLAYILSGSACRTGTSRQLSRGGRRPIRLLVVVSPMLVD